MKKYSLPHYCHHKLTKKSWLSHHDVLYNKTKAKSTILETTFITTSFPMDSIPLMGFDIIPSLSFFFSIGEEYTIRAKCVINATGPYTDQIRTMADKHATQICQPSAGVHIVLPDYYSPENMGLLDPSTSDGRVIFFLPWQNVTLAGKRLQKN